MALLELLPKHLFTTRGWGLLAAGTASLLLAQIMGRRDLLALGILLIVLPLVSLAGVRVLKPRFQVFRDFTPPTVETSSTATVRLAVARTGSSNAPVIMQEQLPPRFGEPPAFRFPARSASGGTSRYEYHLRSGRRGQFKIGPVTAEFCDPFGLSLHRHTIDDGELLTVTPAAVELPATGLAGARGNDGVTATRIQANPSDDDVMTREYRHGDPMRRVHWAATAHHGELMVRQEESVTTPEATIIMDHRYSLFATGPGSRFPAGHDDSFELLSSDSFEWAVTAAMSISAHLAERNYSLRFLDAAGYPAFRGSHSAPFPDAEEYSGSGGLQSISESLAAIQLDGPRHLHVEGKRGDARGGDGGNPDGGEAAFDDHLMDKLAAHRLRGPVLALLGSLGEAEARALAPAAAYGANAFALLVTEHPRSVQSAVDALRQGGWRALAVTPRTQLAAAWSAFDQGEIMAAATAAMDVRRGAAVPR
ncbi:DUF58 domain-containing protein [Arthrobacter silvisoli]|uniref:DUF58 domain-containing protein n=1 Tax=Arthrobacter silvisoli TaxID=2291022 RepID=UPI000E215257|nr:DUF58 domain-containing protein [Arthrobacter silvisoli]